MKQYDDALTELCRALVGEMLDAYIAKLLADKENLINQMVSKMTPPMSDALRGTVHTGGEYDLPWHGKVHPAVERLNSEVPTKLETEHIDPMNHPYYAIYHECVKTIIDGKMIIALTPAGHFSGYRVDYGDGTSAVTTEQSELLEQMRQQLIITPVKMLYRSQYDHFYEVGLSEPLTSFNDMIRMFPNLVKGLSK